MRRPAGALAALGIVPLLALSTSARADGEEDQAGARRDGPARARAAVHGGQVAEIGGVLAEVVLAQDELRVYLYDREGKPLDAAEAAGRAEITAANVVERGRKRVAHQTTGLRLEPRAKAPAKGFLRPHLAARHQLGAEGHQAARLTLSLSGLPGGASGEVELTFPRATPDRRWVCPDGCGGAEARFLDPGACPKCGHELGLAGAKAPEGEGEAEGDDARPRRLRR